MKTFSSFGYYYLLCWLSARKNLRGEDNKPLFFQNNRILFLLFFLLFFKNFRGAKVVLGGTPFCPPVAESQYDCLNKTAPVYFHYYFVSCFHLHHFNTRLASRGDSFLERKNTFQHGIRSIEYNGARLWNMLLASIREFSSASVFQFELKKHTVIYSTNHSECSSKSVLCSDLLIFPFHIMSKLTRHSILALKCLHCFWGGCSVCIGDGGGPCVWVLPIKGSLDSCLLSF